MRTAGHSTRKASGESVANHFKAAIGSCLALAALGCNGTSPTTPSSASSSLSPGPSAPTGPVPVVSGLSVTIGSTGGGTRVTFTGSDLDRGADVTFGGVAARPGGFDPRVPAGTSLVMTTPTHVAGVVDVVITNPNGRPLRLDASYEFVDPDSFDFNGRWHGVSLDGKDVALEFVVTKNELVSARCQYFETITMVLSTEVTKGAFSAEGADGVRLSGRMVSAAQATGRLSAPGCVPGHGETLWQAYKVNEE